ncbi:hypothetical protein IJF86_00645 [Candidatus Saccharibacteria bacterium]|nr:hypothetical protein [Candidatus Saccharibacteria bacterium]
MAMKEITLSKEQYEFLKGLVRIAAVENDDTVRVFPGNKEAEKEAEVIHTLYTEVFA